MKLCGEHDIATCEGLRSTLASISGDVLVDLSECEFVDSSVLCAFVVDSQARALRGTRLELAIAESNARIVRTLQISGLTEVLTVHATPDGLPPRRHCQPLLARLEDHHRDLAVGLGLEPV